VEGFHRDRRQPAVHAVTRHRPSAVLAVAGLLLVGSATPASAGRLARASCSNDNCEADARSQDDSPARGGRRSGSTNPVTCRYVNMRVDPNFALVRPDGSVVQGDGTGQWYERQCVDARELAKISEAAGPNPDEVSNIRAVMDQIQAIDRRPIYVRTRDLPALVDEARSRLAFPLLTPKFSPAAPWTFVNYPTALWLDGDTTAPQTATADAPGVRVTVTATPEEVRWDTGDGATVVCQGPGRAPDPSTPSDHGDCSHVWSWPSAGRPNAAYTVTATVFWHATWTAEGAPGGGDLGLVPQRSEPVRIPVAEIQALNTPPGQ
jgi:hypothetical protein